MGVLGGGARSPGCSPGAPGGGPGTTMGCSDSSAAGALLAGRAAGLAAVAFSHDRGSQVWPPPSAAPSHNVFEQQDNPGGWLGAPAQPGSPVKTGWGCGVWDGAQGSPGGVSGCPAPLRACLLHLPAPPAPHFSFLGRTLKPLGVHARAPWGNPIRQTMRGGVGPGAWELTSPLAPPQACDVPSPARPA